MNKEPQTAGIESDAQDSMPGRNSSNRKRTHGIISRRALVLAALCAPLVVNSAGAAEAAKSPMQLIEKPSWLTEMSLSLREAYDDNLYYMEVGRLADRNSWITTIAPRVTLNFAPLLGDQKAVSVLSLGYAPEFNIFHDESTESFNAHRLTTALKAKSGKISINAENTFSLVDGDDEGVFFDQGRSQFATGAPRERRDQFQDRAKISLQYDMDKWFIRPNASLLYYDLRTTQRLPAGAFAGYENWADRSDANIGVDFGYKIQPQLALTMGYRYGHQHQEQYSATVDPLHLSSPSDYHRVLFGMEGKPLKWLTLSFALGPDFRSYEENSADHTTPMQDLDPVKFYGEAAVTADVTSQDALSFKYRQWQWVASSGKLPYYDSSFELTYRHKFGKQLAVDLGGKLQTADYTCGSVPASARNDWQYTLLAGVSYSFNANLAANLAYSMDLGRNALNNMAPATELPREFDHELVSLALTYKF